MLTPRNESPLRLEHRRRFLAEVAGGSAVVAGTYAARLFGLLERKENPVDDFVTYFPCYIPGMREKEVLQQKESQCCITEVRRLPLPYTELPKGLPLAVGKMQEQASQIVCHVGSMPEIDSLWLDWLTQDEVNALGKFSEAEQKKMLGCAYETWKKTHVPLHGYALQNTEEQRAKGAEEALSDFHRILRNLKPHEREKGAATYARSKFLHRFLQGTSSWQTEEQMEDNLLSGIQERGHRLPLVVRNSFRPLTANLPAERPTSYISLTPHALSIAEELSRDGVRVKDMQYSA